MRLSSSGGPYSFALVSNTYFVAYFWAVKRCVNAAARCNGNVADPRPLPRHAACCGYRSCFCLYIPIYVYIYMYSRLFGAEMATNFVTTFQRIDFLCRTHTHTPYYICNLHVCVFIYLQLLSRSLHLLRPIRHITYTHCIYT